MRVQCPQPNSNTAAGPDCLQLAQIWHCARGQSAIAQHMLSCPAQPSTRRECVRRNATIKQRRWRHQPSNIAQVTAFESSIANCGIKKASHHLDGSSAFNAYFMRPAAGDDQSVCAGGVGAGEQNEAALLQQRGKAEAISAAEGDAALAASQRTPLQPPRRPLHTLNGQPPRSSPFSFQTASALLAQPLPQPIPTVPMAAPQVDRRSAAAGPAADARLPSPGLASVEPGNQSSSSIFAYGSGRPAVVSATRQLEGLAQVKGLELDSSTRQSLPKVLPKQSAVNPAPQLGAKSSLVRHDSSMTYAISDGSKQLGLSAVFQVRRFVNAMPCTWQSSARPCLQPSVLWACAQASIAEEHAATGIFVGMTPTPPGDTSVQKLMFPVVAHQDDKKARKLEN